MFDTLAESIPDRLLDYTKLHIRTVGRSVDHSPTDASGLKIGHLQKVLGRRASIITVLDSLILLKLLLQIRQKPPFSMRDGTEKGVLHGYGRH
jgi:hypothetical protein